MFDWLKNLFSGGSKKPSSSNSRPSQSSSSGGSSGGSSGNSGLRPPLRDMSGINRQQAEDERKQREEEEKKKKAAEAAKRLEEAARLKQQEGFGQILKKPASSGITIDLDSKLQKPAVITDTRSPKQKELDRLAAEKLPKVKQELEGQDNASMKNAGLFDKILYKFGGKQGLDKRAEIAARSRASTEVQEKQGWVGDEELRKYNAKTSEKAKKGSDDAAQGSKNIKSAVDVIRWIPGAGIGELGANAIRGNLSGSKEADDTLLREQNELTQAQIDSLSPEDRNKYLTIAKGGLAAGVLDVVGVGAGSLVKGAGRTALKKVTAKTLAKDIASKEGAKMIAKNAAVGATAGAGIGAGGTKLMGGDDEEALRNAGSGAIAGAFGGAAQSPFDAAVKLTKGKNLVKPVTNALADGEAVDNVDAISKVKLNKVGTTEIVADDAAKIPTAVAAKDEPPENKVEVSPGVKTSVSSAPAETPELPKPAVVPMAEATDVPVPKVEQPVSVAPQIPDPASPIALAKGTDIPTDEVPMADFSASLKAGEPLKKAEATTSDVPAEVTPTQTDVAEAVAQGETPLPAAALDAEGNPVLQSDVEVAQALADKGVVPQRGASVVATEEDAMAREAAQAASGKTNAPNVRAQVTARITDEDLRDDLMTGMPEKDTVNLADAELSAKKYLNDLPDERLVDQFSLGVKVDNPESFFTALNGVRRLERLNTPEADTAIRNALDAMTDYAAESGRGLRTVQVLFDDMPSVMKVDYLMNKLSKAGADLDDATRARLVSLIEVSDDATSSLRGLEDQARKLLDDGSITNGNISPELQSQINNLTEDIRLAVREKEVRSGEAYRFYQEQLDKSPEGGMPLGKRAGDVGRTLMLSSPTGRVFDVLSTSATAADDVLTQNVSSLIGKGVNLVKGRGTVEDTIVNPGKLAKGFREGANRVKESFQGKDHVEDFLGEAKRATRGDINSGGSFLRKGIRAMVETPTNLTRGLRDDELYRQGMQEAAQLGLKDDAQKAYAEVRSIVPTTAQLDKAVDTHMRANMLHENGASRMLNGLARSLDNNKVLGGWLAPVIRNQIAPFTSWLGGNLNRTFTDKNVLYNAGHAVVEARRGNLQGVIDDVSKLAVNSAEAYAVGALLTQAGIITTTDANGDDYAGLYFHVGDRYIPVAAAGTVAVPIILGNAFEQASQAAAEDGNGASAFANALVINTLKNSGVASVFGGENNLQSTVAELAKGQSDVADVGAKFVGDFVRQYIPALTGDVNAFLDHSELNPTGERSDTKILDAEGNTDVIATEIAKTQNRIPFESQKLERQDGAAKDIFDRMTKGTHETEAGVQKRAGEQSLADLKKRYEDEGVPTTADDIKAFADSGDYEKAIKGAQYRLKEMDGDKSVPESRRQEIRDQVTKYGLERDGVPTTDDGVTARIESGEYDQAVRGLQYKLSKVENDEDKPASEKQEIRDDIKRVEITRDGEFPPETVKLYKDTSESEWRAMGNPDSEYYDADMYELLGRYDQLLAEGNVSRSTRGGNDRKLRPKISGSGSGRGGGGGGGGSGIQSLSFDAATNNITFSPDDLVARKAEFATPKSAIPVIQKVQDYDTSKLKKVKVTKGVVR